MSDKKEALIKGLQGLVDKMKIIEVHDKRDKVPEEKLNNLIKLLEELNLTKKELQ